MLKISDIKPFILCCPNFVMVQNSNGSNELLDVVKQYLRIEHQEDDDDLLDYLRKQAGLDK
jgi:hypothetical protein